eukprot:GHVR01019159.1.p1 GENE.GHVR01019159.1~~GHVR01019159.1.p1  ORF type:complete len:564 (-),score=93.16 GHVR01019159.1:129-1799(-)
MAMCQLRQPGEIGVEFTASDGRMLPLEELYFCDTCSKIRSRYELSEEIDSYYCPHCLENMPSSEAMIYQNRCSKCFECPICFNTLIIAVIQEGGKCAFWCQYCRWSSRQVLAEHAKPDQLCVVQYCRERDHFARKMMSRLLAIYRKASQDLAREKELMARMKRRSITILLPVVIQNQTRRPAGLWKLGDLHEMLTQREIDAKNLKLQTRTKEGVVCAFETFDEITQEPDPDAPPLYEPIETAKDVDGKSQMSLTAPLSARTLLGASVIAPEGFRSPLLDPFPCVDANAHTFLSRERHTLDIPTNKIASLSQRLPCVSDQLTLLSTAHAYRKSLLTKRSRRCTECQRILIKPQISPCSSPPFPSRHSIALFHIPKCFVLNPATVVKGETFSLHLAIFNPHEVPIVVSVDPSNVTQRVDDKTTLRFLSEPFESTVAQFNSFADVHESLADEEETPLVEDDPKRVLERKYNRLVVIFEATVKEDVETGALATGALHFKIVFKDKITEDKTHTVTTTILISLGTVTDASTKVDETAGDACTPVNVETPKSEDTPTMSETY